MGGACSVCGGEERCIQGFGGETCAAVSFVCILVRVTMVDKNKTVLCCLLATSAITFSVSQSTGNDVYASMNARVTSLLFILEG